jgi:hypothetical protein
MCMRVTFIPTSSLKKGIKRIRARKESIPSPSLKRNHYQNENENEKENESKAKQSRG